MKYIVHHSWDVSIWIVEANSKEEAKNKVNNHYDNGEESEGMELIDGYGPAVVGVYPE